MQSLIQSMKFVKGLAPAADRWNTSPATDIVSLANYAQCTFLVHQEGGTTGNATFTVEACSDNAGNGATAIPFRYSVGGTGSGASGDATGAVTAATASGFASTPNADKVYVIEVGSAELPADKPWVRLKCTETTNDPVNGAVEIILSGARFAQDAQPSVI